MVLLVGFQSFVDRGKECVGMLKSPNTCLYRIKSYSKDEFCRVKNRLIEGRKIFISLFREVLRLMCKGIKFPILLS